MSSRIDAINITARNHEALGAFWRQILDLHEDSSDPNVPGDPVTCYVSEPVRIRLLFQPVEDSEEFPRIHFDIDAADRPRDAEVERLLAIGAELVADRRKPDGSGWVTLRDPDGYEFCVQRNAAEIAAHT